MQWPLCYRRSTLVMGGLAVLFGWWPETRGRKCWGTTSFDREGEGGDRAGEISIVFGPLQFWRYKGGGAWRCKFSKKDETGWIGFLQHYWKGQSLFWLSPKINIEPENDSLEGIFPFAGAYSQVPCQHSGLCRLSHVTQRRLRDFIGFRGCPLL